jgi:regulator of sirC expression with transglutaminase-like and TPR domain
LSDADTSAIVRSVETVMERSTATKLPSAFSEREKAALLTLLCDDNLGVYQAVRAKIISHGVAAAHWMRGLALSDDPVLRRRSQEIVRYFDRQAMDNRFLGFCLKNGEDLDLEEGALQLAASEYPEINFAAYRAWLDDLADGLRDRITDPTDPELLLQQINVRLFEELGFRGNADNYYDPENSYLNRVLDRRIGNPINLTLVFMLLARRLKLPVTGIGMPGHFLCRYQTPSREIFLDPFNRGQMLTRTDCIKHLMQSGHSFSENLLAPVSSRRMLLRICLNLHHAYIQAGQTDKAARFQRYLIALSN